jgi:O-antigen/teichoic acid export membrane protein
MNMSMKTVSRQGASRLASRLLDNRAVASFFSNLGIVFIFRMAAAVLNIVGLILAARQLGVVALGDIVLVQNIAYFLIIPIVFGIHISTIKYFPAAPAEGADKPGETEQLQERQIIGTIAVCNTVLAALWTALYLSATQAVNAYGHISAQEWALSIVFAVALNFSMVSESVLRAKQKFFLLSIAKLIGTCVFFAIVLACYTRLDTYSYFIIALIVSFALFTLIALIGLRGSRFAFSWEMARQLYRYGGVTMISLLFSNILFASDLFIVNYFCSSYDVGMYSVYQVNVKNFFNLLFHEVFAVVFLPTVAQLDKASMYRMIVKFVPLLLPAAVIGNMALCVALLFFYGKGYPLNWTYVVFVSVSTGLHFIYWIFHSVFSMEGKKGAVMCLTVLGIPLPLLIAVYIVLTKYSGIWGTMAANLITQCVLLAIFVWLVRFKYLNQAAQTAYAQQMQA